MTQADIESVKKNFADAAKRAHTAGYEWLEIHAAHGYLCHEFYSPLSNQRTDEYGGSFENRIRFVLETVDQVRNAWPENLPLTIRLSCSDWVEGGWTIDETVELSKKLKNAGVDLIDCSSGFNTVDYKVYPFGPGWQVPFSERIRKEVQIPTAAVGLITDPKQADDIIRSGKADIVLLARQMLREPFWPYRAAKELNISKADVAPAPYGHWI
jgi:2,4-dienoyl-CoA reductase-like NADH-dependent reductase (Old Yellow Enzyme family)